MNILGDVLLGNEPLLDDPFGEPPPLNGFGDDPDIFLEPASTNPKVTAAAEVDADTLLEPESMDAGSPPPPATVAGNVPEISPHYIDDEEMRQIFKNLQRRAVAKPGCRFAASRKTARRPGYPGGHPAGGPLPQG